MGTIASPKSVQKTIDQLKARLRRLQEEEGKLARMRRSLLTQPQDLKTERELEQTEIKLADYPSSKTDRHRPPEGSGRPTS